MSVVHILNVVGRIAKTCENLDENEKIYFLNSLYTWLAGYSQGVIHDYKGLDEKILILLKFKANACAVDTDYYVTEKDAEKMKEKIQSVSVHGNGPCDRRGATDCFMEGTLCVPCDIWLKQHCDSNRVSK